MVLWGSKGPAAPSLTLSNINMSDHKLQPGGKISRDPSPRSAMTAQLAQQRDNNQEAYWRRERHMEKIRDKAKYNDMDPWEKYNERDRATASKWKEGEREWTERERRQEDDRSRNMRALLNVEKHIEREMERGMKKGDTFPRMAKGYVDYGRRKMSATVTDEERGERRKRDRQRQTETDYWEREREREWQRERYRERERDEIREEGKNIGRRLVEDEKLRERERYQEPDARIQDRRREVGDSRERREKYATRNRETARPKGEEGKTPSPHRQRDREADSDRWEKEKAQKSGGRRDTRSEGDSDERELRRERVMNHKKEHSKSEGDNKGKRVREGDRDRHGYREDNGQRYRDRDREREVDRSRRRGVEKDRERYQDVDKRETEGEKWRERGGYLKDDRAWSNDRRDDDGYREYKLKKHRERKEREADTTGRSSQSLNQTAPRVPPEALSSGEWSSDMDSEMRYRIGRDSYEERELGKKSTSENEKDIEEQRDPERIAERNQMKQRKSERHDSDTGEMTGSTAVQRRMWLEPQRNKNSKEEFVDRERHTREKERRREEQRSMESQANWVREGWQVKRDPDEHLNQHSYRGTHGGRNACRGDIERETEGVSVDGEELDEVLRKTDNRREEHLSDSNGGIEESWRRDAEGENVADNTEDREEEGWSKNYTQVGSETGWKQKNDRSLSGEDFVTVSSGGDDEEEQEQDEDEDFQDCQESWECGVTYDSTSPVGYKDCEREREREEEWTMRQVERVDDDQQGMEKQPKYVFCAIGQTLPRSQSGCMSLSQVDQMEEAGRDNSALEKYCSDDATQQPQDDLHLTPSRNNEYLIIRNQNKEDEAEQNTSKTERSDTGETTEGEIRYITSMLQETEAGKEMRSKVKYPCPEIKQIKRDSQTERLLVQWRGENKGPEEEQRDQPSPVPSNPYADVCPEVNFEQILDEINAVVQNPEKNEAVKMQMSKGWTMFEEPKRHSQAPHLKWAKNVVRNILGHSEEETVDEDIEETETVIRRDRHEEEVAQGTKEIPFITLTTIEQHSDPELEEEDPLEDLRGMGQSQGDTHTEQFTAMYDDTPTHTHADTLLNTEGKKDHRMDKDTEPSGLLQLEKADVEMKIIHEVGDEVLLSETENEKETDMYLTSSNMLYKPNSCPILNYESTSEPIISSKEGKSQEVEDRMGESEEEMQREEPEGCGATVEMGKMEAGEKTELDNREKEVIAERKIEVGTLTSTNSFRDLGPEARIRRRGIRKTTERRDGEPAELEEQEGVGRDRRTRIFSTTDDEDDFSKSWGGGVEIRNVFNTFVRRRRNSKFFKRAQLYQQYNEAAQNLEILSQSGSAAHPLPEDSTQSPAPSPPPARRPLPALPPVLHPHSLLHSSSSTSAKSLALPEPPKREGRPSSPRLSTSFTQSPTLWQDLPGVRNNSELAELTEDQRRLQEVQFEVVTSEASYCRSLDIVVEHFVKSKQLGALLTSQDRNWLFSRLADVRAISHSFLSKLEERVESDIMHFTVCDLIAQHCPRFRKVYVPYLTNQSYQDATYQRLMNENPGFKRIVEKLERSSVCERLPFRSFLVLPFQRITRIKLLVQNIVKRTTPGSAEATQAIKAMKHLEKVIQESNDSISQMKNIESLVSLNAKVDFECKTLPLVSQSRRLIREGPVTELMDFSLKDTERNAYLHLFNDFLLVSLQKEGGRFTVIDHSPVSELRVENCRVKLHTLQKNLFRLHMAHKSLLLRADTQSDKLRWISALSRPHPDVDFSAAQDVPQMQCIRAFVAQQPDELSLDKADIILVHQKTSDHWVEGTRLPDCHRGWVPEPNLETISNPRVRQRNLSDALKLTTATAAV